MACCIAYLGKTFDDGSGHFSLLFLLSVFVYGFLAYRLGSRLIWLFALISLGSWFGTETGYQTHWSYYFLGMNYPLRFVLFGLVVTGSYYILRKQKWFVFFWRTYLCGGLIVFISVAMVIEYFWQFSQYRCLVAYKANQFVLLGHLISCISRHFFVFRFKNPGTRLPGSLA